jgi:hypothetical protein
MDHATAAFNAYKTSLIEAPGMIEDIERRFLFKCAFNCTCLPIVEFGSFFGASTLALASGLHACGINKSKVISIDAFEVALDHPFGRYVEQYSKKYGLSHMLRRSPTSLNWLSITQAVIAKRANQVQLMPAVVDDNFSAECLPDEIGLLHLDLPKNAKTIIPVIDSAFVRLVSGSIIAFQDYAYQFSNELIAFFCNLQRNNIVTPIAIAASTTYYRLNKHISEPANWRLLLCEAVSDQNRLLPMAISQYGRFPNARKQELIALHAAAIRANQESLNDNHHISKQKESIARHIKSMGLLCMHRSAFVLSELFAEKVEPHR